jgi:DNA-binding CsgD family transcriptional regulator
MGKTTLWEAAAAAAADQGRRVLVARPVEAERSLGLAIFADLVEPVVDEVLPELAAPQRRALEAALLLSDGPSRAPDVRTLGAALVASLRVLGGEGGAVLAIDDLQWVDGASRAVLDFALRRLSEAGGSAVLAVRAGEATGHVPDFDRRSRVSLVDVRPLGVAAVQRLIVDRLGVQLPRPLLRRLHAAAGGSPFYVLELARALRDQGAPLRDGIELALPYDLGALLRERLARLKVSTRRALAAASALAEPQAELIEAEGDLQPALDAGVVWLEHGLVRFSHPLLASAAYSLLTPKRRRDLHARLAALVEDPEQRARHLAAASCGPDESVALELAAAARRASARGAFLAAGELLEMALEFTADPDGVATHRSDAARAYLRGGDVVAARRLAESAVDALLAGPCRARELALLSQLRLDDLGVAASLAEQAWREARGDAGAEAVAAAQLSYVCGFSGDVSRALELAEEALARSDQLPDTAVVPIVAQASLIQLVSYGRVDPELVAVGVEAERRSGGLSDRWEARYVPAMQLLTEERFSEARADVEALVAHNETLGYESRVEDLLNSLTEVETRAGRPAVAAEHAARVAEMREQAGTDPLTAALGSCFAAHVAAVLGRVDQARALTTEGLAASAAAGDVAWGLHHAAALGFLELSLGNAEAAVEVLTPAAERLRKLLPGMHPLHIPLLPDLIEALILQGRSDEARTHLGYLEQRGRALDSPGALAAAARADGLLAAAAGDLEPALEAFERALREHARRATSLDQGRTLLARGAVLRRARRWAAARDSLAAALDIFEEIGASLWVQKTRAELGRIGGRKAADGLTPTEQRVAALVAEGRSNKQVARELFVAVRTVEFHLSNIYDKLHIRSRTELAALLALPTTGELR